MVSQAQADAVDVLDAAPTVSQLPVASIPARAQPHQLHNPPPTDGRPLRQRKIKAPKVLRVDEGVEQGEVAEGEGNLEILNEDLIGDDFWSKRGWLL